MSDGVRCGSRLDQLRALAAQVKLAIEVEERNLREGRVDVRPRRSVSSAVRQVVPPLSPAGAKVVMARHGVTPAQVRAWATAHGLTTAVRGAVSTEIVEAYDEAHQTVTA